MNKLNVVNSFIKKIVVVVGFMLVTLSVYWVVATFFPTLRLLTFNSTHTRETKKVEQEYSGNRIRVPPGYTKELFDTISGEIDTQEPNTEDLLKLEAVEKIAQQGLDMTDNHYLSSKVDRNYWIEDVNRIPLEIRIDISLFATELLNDVREQMGISEKFYVNDISLEFSQVVAEEYLVDNWGFKVGHNIPAINRAASQLGLKEYPSNGYENLIAQRRSGNIRTKTYTQSDGSKKVEQYYSQPFQKGISLDELKKAVYDSLLHLLFDDGQNPRDASNKNSYGHTKSLLGVAEHQGRGDSYLGISISFYSHPYETEEDYIYTEGVEHPTHNTRLIHFISFNEQDIVALDKREEQLSHYYQRH